MYTQAEPDLVGSAEVIECLVAHISLLKVQDLGLNSIILDGDCENIICYLEGDVALWPLDCKTYYLPLCLFLFLGLRGLLMWLFMF